MPEQRQGQGHRVGAKMHGQGQRHRSTDTVRGGNRDAAQNAETLLTWFGSPQEGHSQEEPCRESRERAGGCRQSGCSNLSQCPHTRLPPVSSTTKAPDLDTQQQQQQQQQQQIQWWVLQNRDSTNSSCGSSDSSSSSSSHDTICSKRRIGTSKNTSSNQLGP